MKKAMLTIGLFSMMLVLTSFTQSDPEIKDNHTIYSIDYKFSNDSQVGQQIPAQIHSLEFAIEPGGNGQQVPAQRLERIY